MKLEHCVLMYFTTHLYCWWGSQKRVLRLVSYWTLASLVNWPLLPHLKIEEMEKLGQQFPFCSLKSHEWNYSKSFLNIVNLIRKVCIFCECIWVVSRFGKYCYFVCGTNDNLRADLMPWSKRIVDYSLPSLMYVLKL